MSIDNVEDITPRVQYVASASQAAFDYPFPIFTDTDLVVTVDGVTKVLTTDYTVSGAGADTGGTVTFTSGQTAGAIVTIYRDIAIERTTDFQTNGPLASASFNDEFDRMTLVDQQLESRINRCLRIPIDADVNDADIELAPFSSWLGKYVTIDSTGKPAPAVLSDTTMTKDALTALGIRASGIEYPQTAAESAAPVTPVNLYYEPGDPLRFYDGSGDYSQALQDVFNSGETVDFKSKQRVYTISSGVTIPSNTRIYGRGATIKRISGAGVFTMLENSDTVGGNSGIEIVDPFLIDGNKDADSLVATNPGDIFSGMRLVNCTGCKINIEVTGTVNAEADQSGLYIQDSTDMDVWVKAYSNDRTGVYTVGSTIRFHFGWCYNNLGSGISGNTSDECSYDNIWCHDNGYSQLSVNGLKCTGKTIRCWNGASGYANFNIGHDNTGNHSDGSIFSDVFSGTSAGWGVTIVGSNDVTINGLQADGATSYNLRVFSNSNRSIINGGEIKNCAISGASYDSGTGHFLDGMHIHSNGSSGLSIGSGVEVTTGPGFKAYNNGQVTSSNSAGVLNVGGVLHMHGGETYDDQGTKTQESGVYCSGGSYELNKTYVPVNKTYAVRTASSPVAIVDTSRLGTDAQIGTFTPAASATTATVNNNNIQDTRRVRFWARNAAAVTRGVPYCSAVTAGTSFTVTLPGAASGTELYSYEVW